jgi:arylsulfatase A-like enzyme
MIARWPGRIKPDTTSDLPWYFPDVMPTLAELADAMDLVPSDIDGISVVATLLGKGKQSRHEYLYWEFGRTRAVRMGRFKAIRKNENAQVELYDLAEDIGEKNDIASQHPDIAAKMGRIMQEAHVDPRPQIEPKKPKGKRFL